MKRRGLAVLALALLATVASACVASPSSLPVAAGATPGALETVKLGVGFVPNVQFAPLYVGIDKGYFADEGIDLKVEYGFENDYVSLVGAGEYDFMVGSGDQVILARAQGLPVRYVLNWYARYPVVLFSLASAGIEQPADMRGRTIGLPGAFGANYVAFRGLLEAGGLGEQDVRAQSIGFTQAAAVSEGTVDAAVDYAANGPVVLDLAGKDTTVIGLDDYLTMPANGLLTNDQTIADNPDLVARMARALRRSIDATLADPDDAFAISLRYVPEAGGPNEAANRAVFDASIDYWRPAEGQTPGATRAEDWAAAAEFMQRIGLAQSVVPAADLFTNDFVPQPAQTP